MSWCHLRSGGWSVWGRYGCSPLDQFRWIVACDLWWFWCLGMMWLLLSPSSDMLPLIVFWYCVSWVGCFPLWVDRQRREWGWSHGPLLVDEVHALLHLNAIVESPISFARFCWLFCTKLIRPVLICRLILRVCKPCVPVLTLWSLLAVPCISPP